MAKKAKKPPTRKRSTLQLWIAEQTSKLFPPSIYGHTFDRETAREALFRILPGEFIPTYQELLWNWFVRETQRAWTENGYGLPGGHAGTTIQRKWLLPLKEFSELLVERLEAAKDDIESVRADLIEWARLNDPTLNIDQTMDGLLRAAGLK